MSIKATNYCHNEAEKRLEMKDIPEAGHINAIRLSITDYST